MQTKSLSALQNEFDLLGRLQRPGETQTLSQTIDHAGRRISQTDASGGVTAYQYNHAGRLVGQTSSYGQQLEYTYYDNGYTR
ncbi:RHS repeat protein, partial [Chitinimonas sp. DQS-5]|nr:RHS repeat protein [Parachitinimonas caeni]